MEPWRKHLQALVRGDEAGVVTSLLGSEIKEPVALFTV